MANLSSLTSLATAATALSNLILVSPQSVLGYQPQASPNTTGQTSQLPPAFLFHYEGEQTATLTSDITDNFLEDNTAVQDQIALKPVMVSTHGYIGELNDITPSTLGILKTAAQKLTIISAYTPALSQTALLAYNTAFQLYQVALNAQNSAVAAWSTIAGSGNAESVITGQDGFPIALEPNQNKQQTAFQQFFGYWNNRTLFTIQTPWAIFQNMAISSLRAVQSEETVVITDFELTFKQLRFASTLSSSSGLDAQGRLASQAASVANLGSQTPISVSASLLSRLANAEPGGPVGV